MTILDVVLISFVVVNVVFAVLCFKVARWLEKAGGE